MDFDKLNHFYNSNLGNHTLNSIETIIKQNVNINSDDIVVGVGYATPYIIQLRQNTKLSLIPSFIEKFNLPHNDINIVCEEEHLPLPNNSCDVAILVHSIEHSNNPWGLCAEINRLLPSGGRLIVVVPNRVGIWARNNNPFGQGRPYTKGQLRKLLNNTGFTEIKSHYSLYFPPFKWISNQKIFSFCEKWLKYFMRENSGVIIGVYEKQQHKYVESKERFFKIPLIKLRINL